MQTEPYLTKSTVQIISTLVELNTFEWKDQSPI